MRLHFSANSSIFTFMTAIAKFLSDIEKIKKYDRQNHGNQSDYKRFSRDIRNLFERSSSCPGDLPGSVFEYWENEYIFKSQDIKEEPLQENCDRLAAMLSFLNGDDEDLSMLSDLDWQEIGKLVNYESEDLPIDVLQELMKVLVEKNAY